MRQHEHLPYNCSVCLTLCEKRAKEWIAYRRRRRGCCAGCGLKRGHTPDCERHESERMPEAANRESSFRNRRAARSNTTWFDENGPRQDPVLRGR
jgi:hypothetical protein